MSLLHTINGHDDLIALNDQQRTQLCEEIRSFLVESVSQTGGHLASNLGVVELTVAVETVFNTNKDRLVFDVGHQSYVHKLLTGRQADFARLRQFGGIAGFPKPAESDTDAFVAGHASSSVSVALGMARARTLMGESYDVVALIGDGATTGGMAYEGLNDAAVSREPMVVILNDNEMSIDRNVGGMAKHLSRLRTKERYLGMKNRYRNALSKVPGGKWVHRITSKMKSWLKRVLLPGTMFEHMGLTYLGPVDGHDLPELIRVLRVAKSMRAPVLVHVLTNKGQGYKFAEQMPSKFHGIGRFDPISGNITASGKESFSDVFGETMIRLGAQNSKLCAITAAMPGGTGLLKFQEQFPQRLFDVGIAEEHAVSMAGGLAKQGMIPVVALYSTFLQRSFDQIVQDVAMLGLHVVFAVDRAGLVGEDGETHHGVFDVQLLRQIPGMSVLCPANCMELEQMLDWAINVCQGPVAVRYPRGGDGALSDSSWDGQSRLVSHRKDGKIGIVTYGTIVNNVIAAADILSREGIQASVIRLLFAAPIPDAEIRDALQDCDKVVVVEEVCSGAGIGDTVARVLPGIRVARIDLGENFVTHGSVAELYKAHGLDPQSIAEFVRKELSV